MNAKAQLSLWIILALIIVITAVALVVFLSPGPFVPPSPTFTNPTASIEQCTSEALSSAEQLMLPQGGILAPTQFKLYGGNKVSYLCLNEGYFKPCINQHPILLSEIQQQLQETIDPKINDCFMRFAAESRKRNVEVTLGDQHLNVVLGPGVIRTTIVRDVHLTKDNETRNYHQFLFEQASPLFDLATVALTIASQEATYCNFDSVGYMMLHPQFTIKVNSLRDSTKIYSINDPTSHKEMEIAIRSCAMPEGV